MLEILVVVVFCVRMDQLIKRRGYSYFGWYCGIAWFLGELLGIAIVVADRSWTWGSLLLTAYGLALLSFIGVAVLGFCLPARDRHDGRVTSLDFDRFGQPRRPKKKKKRRYEEEEYEDEEWEEESPRRRSKSSVPKRRGSRYDDEDEADDVEEEDVGVGRRFRPGLVFGILGGLVAVVTVIVIVAMSSSIAEEQKIEACLQAMASRDPGRREEGARQLRTLAPTHRRDEVARALGALLFDGHPQVQMPAILALEKWARAEDIPLLIKAIGHPKREIHMEVCKIIGTFKDERTIKPLMKSFPYADTRLGVMTAFRKMGPMVENELIPYLKSQELDLCRDTINVLKDIGTQRSVPALRALASGRNVVLRDASREALSAITARGKN
jgi:hypothetical protein